MAYPRAAVIGNPSDGFFGKTIAFPFSEFQVTASLKPIEGTQVQFSGDVHFESLSDFYNAYLNDQLTCGRNLVSATLKKFKEHCDSETISLHRKGFELAFECSIPREVGLAGSSAIITALLRTLLSYYEVSIPLELQANLILEVETQELGISAGLQDRVVQAFETPVYMDFDKAFMERHGHGRYSILDAGLFQHIYVAYKAESAESSDVVHNNLGERYGNGDPKVHAVMEALSELADAFHKELLEGQSFEKLKELMDRNFDLRQSVCAISKNNLEMIEIARAKGASAKFTGSGGAIIGVYETEEMYKALEKAFQEKGIQVFKPSIVSSER